MKKLFVFFFFCYAFTLKAQHYTFNRTVGTYTNLTGATTLMNGTWSFFAKGVKLPFPFKLFNTSFTDSLYINNTGTINIDDTYSGDIVFVDEDLRSRGSNKSEVSYVVEGTTPNRIFKLQFSNAGFSSDSNNADSIHIQAWLYETSNIIEFVYGSSLVGTGSWSEAGPYTQLFDPTPPKFMSIEGNTTTPIVNTTNLVNSHSLSGVPAIGTIYRFTPSQFPNGINNTSIKINVIQNKISLPGNLEVKRISILNANGQTLQVANTADGINLSTLPAGFYLVTVDSQHGIITRKLLL